MSDSAAVLSAEAARTLAAAALTASGASPEVAVLLARIHVDAEGDGIASHGLARIPGLCAQLKASRVNGRATPRVIMPRPGMIVADAQGGFPQPAFELGFADCLTAARSLGIACLVVRNAWAADVMGWHVERFAEAGFLALGFANVPAAIAPVGGTKPVFGTNPITCAIPQAGKPPIMIDQASSVVAKSEIVDRADAGRTIPMGWALDAEGSPTESAARALAGGSLMPTGGYKGVGIALIVELFTAVLSGSQLSLEAPPLGAADAPPVQLSQTYVVVDPSAAAGDGWLARAAIITDAIEAQTGARVPGARRFAARAAAASGLRIAPSLKAALEALAGQIRTREGTSP